MKTHEVVKNVFWEVVSEARKEIKAIVMSNMFFLLYTLKSYK